MLSRQNAIVWLALVLLAVPAGAGTLVYVVNGSQQFGTIDLTSGAFHQIGPNTPEGETGLAQGPNGSLLTLTFSGNLDSINPATGLTTVIGPTGLADCTTLTSPCGPTSANTIANLGGTLYATDYSNDLYTVSPATGAATLIGTTGIPALPFVPLSTNPDGSVNVYDAGLFGFNGSLYATFDAASIDFSTFTITPVVAPSLYRIDPTTGHATLVGPTDFGLGALVNVNGTPYAFSDSISQVVTIDLATGTTSFYNNFDPSAQIIAGAVAATPEPASLALGGIGMLALVAGTLRKRCGNTYPLTRLPRGRYTGLELRK